MQLRNKFEVGHANVMVTWNFESTAEFCIAWFWYDDFMSNHLVYYLSVVAAQGHLCLLDWLAIKVWHKIIDWVVWSHSVLIRGEWKWFGAKLQFCCLIFRPDTA